MVIGAPVVGMMVGETPPRVGGPAYRKPFGEVPAPTALRTTTSTEPAVARAGAVTVSEVSSTTVRPVPGTPSKVTPVTPPPAWKLTPVMVTEMGAPRGPAVG